MCFLFLNTSNLRDYGPISAIFNDLLSVYNVCVKERRVVNEWASAVGWRLCDLFKQFLVTVLCHIYTV